MWLAPKNKGWERIVQRPCETEGVPRALPSNRFLQAAIGTKVPCFKSINNVFLLARTKEKIQDVSRYSHVYSRISLRDKILIIRVEYILHAFQNDKKETPGAAKLCPVSVVGDSGDRSTTASISFGCRVAQTLHRASHCPRSLQRKLAIALGPFDGLLVAARFTDTTM